jgi:hypothetical protein
MCVGGYDIVNKTYIGWNTNLSNTNVKLQYILLLFTLNLSLKKHKTC